MFNVNSPIIQQMMNEINPNNGTGVINPGMYMGATPTVAPQSSVQAYPDPMQMSMMQQQQRLQQSNANYNTVPNVVSPLFLQGYSNPYFSPSGSVPNFSVAVNSYMPNYMNLQYGNGQQEVRAYDPTIDPFYGYDPSDEHSRSVMQNAIDAGVTYMDQLQTDTEIFQKGMELFFKNTENTSPEAKDKIRKYYSVQEKKVKSNNPFMMDLSKSSSSVDCSKMVVVIMRGEEEVSRINKAPDEYTLARCEYMAANEGTIYNNFIQYQEYLRQRDIYLYENATERQGDNMDMFDFLKNVAPKIVREMKNQDFNKSKVNMILDIYNSQAYRNLIHKTSGKKINPPNIIQGRNGILPNGMLVSPGVDPRVAEGFVRDANTGQITLTVPDFIKNRVDDSPFRESILQKEMDARKAAFMKSLHDNVIREEILSRGG